MAVNVGSGNWKQLKPLTSDDCFKVSVLHTVETLHIICPRNICNIKNGRERYNSISNPSLRKG